MPRATFTAHFDMTRSAEEEKKKEKKKRALRASCDIQLSFGGGGYPSWLKAQLAVTGERTGPPSAD